jgi:hypothetical protein
MFMTTPVMWGCAIQAANSIKPEGVPVFVNIEPMTLFTPVSSVWDALGQAQI